MLKIRVMPTLLFKDVGLVKGIGFDSWRRVGSAVQAVKVYNMREVDELVFFDISATPDRRRPDFSQIEDLAAECFMPMTVGGGVRSTGDIQDLLSVGADKVAINTAAVETPILIREGADRFGTQCISVGIDAMRLSDRWEVYTHCGKHPTGLDPVEHARRVEALGAGEIILTSIDRDGTMRGYDVELARRVASAVKIPVVASGGAGSYADMAEVLRQTRASAVAAASIYHFTEQTPREAKLYLREHGFNVRL
jgi:cyclase